jgi:hypothetical protein
MKRCERQLARLVAAMAPWQPDWTWREVRLADAANVRYLGNTVQVPQRMLCSIQVYADRFDQHLRAGYSWVNLHAAGIVDGVLVVIVELPNHPSGARDDQVAVNLSGPTVGVRVEVIDDWGRSMLASAVVDAINQACDKWICEPTDPAARGERLARLTQWLLTLTTNSEIPRSVANDVEQWCQQLQAASQWWSREGDIRGLGRAEAIIRAMKVWADELRLNVEAGAEPDRDRM